MNFSEARQMQRMEDNERLVTFARMVRSMAVEAAQLMDAAKAEWEQEGAWSWWDADTRKKVTDVLVECEKIINPEPLK